MMFPSSIRNIEIASRANYVRAWRMSEMNSRLTVGDVLASTGELRFGSLGGVELCDNTYVRLPVMIARGVGEGPTLLVQGAVHGNELIGAEVVRKLLREGLDCSRLKGAVIGIPISNPLAFQFGKRTTPQDEGELSGTIPGNPSGSVTERLAHLIFQAMEAADYVIDLHGNWLPCAAFTSINLSVGEESVKQKAELMAEAFGLTIVYSTVGGPKHLSFLMQRGKPSILVELIDAKRITMLSVGVGVRGILNVMKVLGMIEGKIEKQPPELIFGHGRVESGGTLLSNRGGILHVEKEPGTRIRQGEVVARLLDAYGEKIEEIDMPFDGYIRAFTYSAHQAVATGQTIAYVTKDK